jgi:ribonuclease P protein component
VLPRDRRLRAGRDWGALFHGGFGVGGPLVSLRVMPTKAGRRVGFSVGKKVGGAVVRNLVKRRLRAIAAEHWDALPEADIGLLARPAAAHVDYFALNQAVEELIVKARARISPEAR